MIGACRRIQCPFVSLCHISNASCIRTLSAFHTFLQSPQKRSKVLKKVKSILERRNCVPSQQSPALAQMDYSRALNTSVRAREDSVSAASHYLISPFSDHRTRSFSDFENSYHEIHHTCITFDDESCQYCYYWSPMHHHHRRSRRTHNVRCHAECNGAYDRFDAHSSLPRNIGQARDTTINTGNCSMLHPPRGLILGEVDTLSSPVGRRYLDDPATEREMRTQERIDVLQARLDSLDIDQSRSRRRTDTRTLSFANEEEGLLHMPARHSYGSSSRRNSPNIASRQSMIERRGRQPMWSHNVSNSPTYLIEERHPQDYGVAFDQDMTQSDRNHRTRRNTRGSRCYRH